MAIRKNMGKGRGKGFKNLIPQQDSRTHSLSARGIKQPQRINPMINLSEKQISNRLYEKEVIDSINGESYGKTFKSDKEKLQFLKDTFRSEFWDNNPSAQRMGEQNAFKEWISGLPSTFNIPFTYHDIIKLAKKNKSLPINSTEKQEDRVIENYWNFMANKTFLAFRKYNVK